MKIVITRIFRSAAVFLLLLIFLAGSTGISFFVHTCGSSHKKDVFAFREIFHQDIGCCCVENDAAKTPPGTSSYSDDGCCKTSHLFVKAPFIGFPVTEKLTVNLSVVELPMFSPSQPSPSEDSGISFVPYTDTSPPPLSGITLVYFLHQIRIPAPAC
ncbi:MAG: hypothetical protein NTW10_10570 [Bacteroidetes bacterium]|nr:hypothetical protein [Bacteroidota bacterium]